MSTEVGRRNIDIDTDYGVSFSDLGVVGSLSCSLALLTSSNSLHQVLLRHFGLSIIVTLGRLSVVL